MFKSEKGMSKLELVITIATIFLIVACSILLALGEDGISFLPENGENVNQGIENNVDNTNNSEER